MTGFFVTVTKQKASARMESRIHDPCYHGLKGLSIPYIVLVFGKRTHCFEWPPKEKKTKG